MTTQSDSAERQPAEYDDQATALGLAQMPRRQGPPPRVYPGPPQHQLDQLPSDEQWRVMRSEILAWQDVATKPSMRAVPGTLGLYLPVGRCQVCDPDRFLIANEFAHHHPRADGGLHLVLPPEWHEAAIEKGWAVPHTLAGRPTVSVWTVLAYAPRDDAEREVVMQLVRAAESFATGA